jgi:Polyketide cyclase / dehydrase and lipid transport
VLKKIVIALVVAVAGFAVLVALQPSMFTVSRSTTMAAAPADVFAHVNDFHNWEAWSPWAKLDPKSKVTFEGAESGKGAIFKWSGNSDVGEGSMTIVDSQPARQIRIDLTFIRPFASTAHTVFDFAPAGTGTKVSWTMSGKNDNFIAKAFCLVLGGPNRMIGPDFEKGLAQMKTVVEKGAPAGSKT